MVSLTKIFNIKKTLEYMFGGPEPKIYFKCTKHKKTLPAAKARFSNPLGGW
jgi:hypothetical protein